MRFRLTFPPFLNPLLIYSAVWGTVYAMYTWRISAGLIFSADEALWPFCFIVGSYLLPAFAISFLASSVGMQAEERELDTGKLKQRLRMMVIWWAVINFLQILYSGGFPLLWMAIGITSKGYLDFGIPSVNGMSVALTLTIGMMAYLLYVLTGERKWLWVLALVVFWAVICIYRKVLVVLFIQTTIIYLIVYSISVLRALKLVGAFLVAVLAFGFIGDFRTGRDIIIKYAHLVFEYPEWAPSGFIWVYMYVTSPLNNILNSIINIAPEWNYNFERTFSALFPSVIRDGGPTVKDFGQYWTVSDSFNVSTAYIRSYLDLGLTGIFFFNTLIAVITAGLYYFSRSMSAKLMYVVFVQALALTIFNDNFTNLNNCFQVFFIYVAFRGIEGPAGVAAPRDRGMIYGA